MMTENQKNNRRGRPRCIASTQAILDAALKLCQVNGLQNMTIDQLSREAGVGKQTIYRWWGSLEDVVFDALMCLATSKISKKGVSGPSAIHPLDFIQTTFREAKKIKTALKNIMAISQLDTSFKNKFYNQFIRERREVLAIVLSRHWPGLEQEKTMLLVDTIFGFMWYRLLLEHLPLGDNEAAFLYQLIDQTAKNSET